MTELQEIAENASRSIENLNQQVQEEPTEDLPMGSRRDPGPVWPMHELLGLDKELRSIRDSLKVEVAKKVQLEERIKKKNCKLKEFQEYPGEHGDDQRRQEPINLLKGRLKNQITSFCETIAKVLDSNTSLAEKI